MASIFDVSGAMVWGRGSLGLPPVAFGHDHAAKTGYLHIDDISSLSSRRATLKPFERRPVIRLRK